ncbi:MAG: DUF6134 family protein [Bacteroidota bacterium]
MKRLLTIIIFLFVSSVAFGQVLHYDVVKGNKKLGNMTVKRTVSQNGTYYEINSEVTFRILFSFTVEYESTSEYKYGQLIKEYTHNQLNGSTQKKSTIWFDGEKYVLDLDGIRFNEKPPITYSVGAIYYEEPNDGEKVYSPQFGEYLTFERVGEHNYEMKSPDGLNVYTYKNGICTKVRVNRDFAKFSFVMTPESLIAVETKKILGGGMSVD